MIGIVILYFGWLNKYFLLGMDIRAILTKV